MVAYVLSFKPAVELFGVHDPSAALFEDGELLCGAEEERFTRDKHAPETFPERSIRWCLDEAGIGLGDVETVILPYDLSLRPNVVSSVVHSLKRAGPLPWKMRLAERDIENAFQASLYPTEIVNRKLDAAFEGEVPPIEMRSHHACHAASAFHPTDMEEALVLTLDGKGEYDSTVVWRGDTDGLRRERTYEFPNSLGHLYGAVTEFLGYRAFNGEGKVMGLAPYGEYNEAIADRLTSEITTGVDYDVTGLTGGGMDEAVERLGSLFDRSPSGGTDSFDDWEQDLAHVTQRLVEDIVVDVVEHYLDLWDLANVCLAGGVALNCKMNKRVMELDAVDNIFVQPVAHDGGLAVGGGYVDRNPGDVPPMRHVYWGPEYDTADVRDLLETNKVRYEEPDDLERVVAEALADGQLVGWFQGRLEMGPRALGNRSILADPRTIESRDRVNRYVKHREEWRPFAPSLLEEAADDYLVNAEPSPYMIKTFDVVDERAEDISAVLHPGDDTTRPQTVREDTNPRYHRLISEFEDITGVPVVLNTSFNDHGEPIVNTPKEALKDFFGMGLDVLAMEDLVVRK